MRQTEGLLAVGTSIPLAFSNLFNLQFACETQVLAMAGRPTAPAAAGGVGAHRQARRRAASAVRHGVARALAQARSPGPVLPELNSLQAPARAFSRVAVSDIAGVSASGIDLEMQDRGLARLLCGFECAEGNRRCSPPSRHSRRRRGHRRRNPDFSSRSPPRARDNGAPGACGWCRTCRCPRPRR